MIIRSQQKYNRQYHSQGIQESRVPINKPFSFFRKKLNYKGIYANSRINNVAITAFIFILLLDFGLTALLQKTRIPGGTLVGVFLVFLLVGLYVLFALKIANQWEEAVVLRLGKFLSLQGPGLFWAIPIVDSITDWVDLRVLVTPFNAEKSLTKDKVPITVDAVLIWRVWDAEKAALEIKDYSQALASVSQTALREVINSLELEEILVGWARMSPQVQNMIDARSNSWGVTVQSVEIRNIIIPPGLEDLMSHQAKFELENNLRHHEKKISKKTSGKSKK